MKVLKFGGTSVGNAESIRQVAEIITSSKEQLIVVTSAVGGVTDQLVKMSDLASRGDDEYKIIIEHIALAHQKLYYDLLGQKPGKDLIKITDELEEIGHGMWLLKELTPRSSDFVLGCGERLSNLILFDYLKQQNVKVKYFDSRDFIVTDSQFGKANVNFKKTTKNIKAVTKEFEQVNLFPGFISSSEANEPTTLGRGGSDFTAAILAGILNVDNLEIWTDVDGLMTADPRLVKHAHFIEHVSYEEALELSHFGAKVIYPPSIQPALQKGIPITIKNTFNPEHPGTLITKKWDEGKQLIRGISSIKDIAMVTLSGSGMVGIPRFSFRLFRSLSEARINVVFITQASSEHSISVGVRDEDARKSVDVLNKEFSYEIEAGKINMVEAEVDLSILALVGNNMKDQVGVSGQMFSILGKNGISVKAIAQGSSERNISAVIPKVDLRKALNALHESFFLSDYRRINLFIIGAGNVGKAFMTQIGTQNGFLKEHYHLDIKVIAIANSRKMTFDQQGLPATKWQEHLDSGEKFKKELFLEKMHDMNMRNSIFVDITAASEIAGLYPSILKRSVSVVTPNKIAATGPQDHYLELKGSAKKYGGHFLFETNVCAGLPILSTLTDLIKSGDEIHRIEAVLSGTLNFLFNEYDGKKKFVEVIKEAKKLGYTEPDPRLDLFMEDVKRKILILIRESGYSFELNDIIMKSFLPKSCLKSSSVEDFYDKIEKEEDHFRSIYEKAKEKGKRLRVVAKYKNGVGNVSLDEVESTHPFYNLEGKDNIVLFYTNRYKDQPLEIKGAGAGADVTASGIFADVLRIAQSYQ